MDKITELSYRINALLENDRVYLLPETKNEILYLCAIYSMEHARDIAEKYLDSIYSNPIFVLKDGI